MLEKLKSMSVGAAIIFSILLFGAYYLLQYNTGEEISSIIYKNKQDIKMKAGEKARLEKVILASKKFEVIESKMGEVLNRILEYLPTDIRPREVVKLIEKAASDAELNIISMGAGGGRSLVVKGAPFTKLPIRTELDGDFSQIMIFLSALTKVNKIITIEKMKIHMNTAGKIKFSGTFMGYKYNQDKGKI